MKSNRHIRGLTAILVLTGVVATRAQPPNSLPCGATGLTVSESCDFLQFNNMAAGDSEVPDPGCGSYEGGDVWFYVVVPPDSTVAIQTYTEAEAQFPENEGWMYRAAMALYRGSCDSLSLVGCYENNSIYHPRMAGAVRSGEVLGDTLWVRIWENSNNDNGKFEICVSGSEEPGEECPEQFLVSGGGGFCNGDTGQVVSLSGSGSGIRYTLLLNDTIRLDTLEGDGGPLHWSPLTVEGRYTVEAENPLESCVVMMIDTAAIGVWALPALSIDAVSITCFADNDGSISMEVVAETPYEVVWTGPGGFETGQSSIQNLSPGDYMVVVSDSNHCTRESGPVTITEPDLLVASVHGVEHLSSYEAEDGSVDLEVTGGTPPYQGTWSGTDAYLYEGLDPEGMSVGYYDVMVTDSHLCQDSVEGIIVSVAVDSGGVFIPEGFSPNGDGLNDLFVILGIEEFPENELVIMNRQGVQLLHRVNYQNDWDGTPEQGGVVGGQLPEGTYYYVFRYGTTGLRKGYVYINRE